MTVAHLIDEYLAAQRALVSANLLSPNTLEWYSRELRKLRSARTIHGDLVADMPAAEVRMRHLTDIKCTYHFLRAVKAIYSWAVDEELLPYNPFRKTKLPPCGERNRTLTREELVRLYHQLPRVYRRLIMVARYTMARPGEIRTLQWKNVHLDHRLIVLRKFKAKEKRADKASVRKIPLALPLVRLLRNIQSHSFDPGPDGFVFLGRRGDPITKNALCLAIRRARARAGLGPDEHGEQVVCYSLRHTAATNATRNGVGDRQLADVLGHTTTKTTARYQHLAAGDLIEAIDLAFARAR